jgi:uncharacterized membrane protein YidH (DUF202 family)
MWEVILIGILFVVFGVVIFIKPIWLWQLTEKWKTYSADEPSDYYIIITKISSVLCVLAGVFFVVAPFVIK